MTLRVYNTLTRQKEEFKPIEPGKVRMYVCGPTVYKPSHIGHMVGPVIFDTVKRYLTYLGYQVTWVVNITDVDDKLIVRSRELGTTVKELAEKMTADYLQCLKRLNVTGIDQLPRATEHIPGMIEMMQGLIQKGFAYAAGGDVYFDIGKDEDYGKLCNRDPEQLEAGARIEVSDKKRNPGDFALWKSAKPGEPSWDSPWGKGRPGWHIECSVMSMKLLGQTLDIHGGGLDLQFPHHENELAQSESYSGQPFSRVWMHNNLLKMGTAKMAGSVGNVVNVADLLHKHSAETVRFLLLSTHYRSPIEYSDERLGELAKAMQAFYRLFERFERITGDSFFKLQSRTKATDPHAPTGGGEFSAQVTRRKTAFFEHMDDDFNTAGAIGVLFELLSDLNRFADINKLEEKKPSDFPSFQPPPHGDFRDGVAALKELSSLLGLFESPPVSTAAGNDQLAKALSQLLIDIRAEAASDQSIEGLMRRLIDLRAEARKAKNFAMADQIRKRLGELNVTLEDRPGGTGWRVG